MQANLCLKWKVVVIVLYYFAFQMGAYHTIELELNRKFTLAKKNWDSVVLDRIGKQMPPQNSNHQNNYKLFTVV